MAGIVDWDAIEDRGRQPKLPYFVTGIKDALNDTIEQYRLDRMEGQERYIEVWVEKRCLVKCIPSGYRKVSHQVNGEQGLQFMQRNARSIQAV